jgi:hypothetical protein
MASGGFETLTEEVDMMISSSWNVGHLDCLGMREDKFPVVVLVAMKGPFLAVQ